MTRNDDRKPKSREFSQQEQALGELLCAYLDDELNPAQRAEVEARIESDPVVRAQLDELTFSADALRSLPSGSAPLSILDDITTRAERTDLLGKPEESVTLARHRRGPFKSTMALAAMLMVAVSASLYVTLQVKQNNTLQRQVAVNQPDGRSLAKEHPESANSQSKLGMDTAVASRGGSSDRAAELKRRDLGTYEPSLTDLRPEKAKDGTHIHTDSDLAQAAPQDASQLSRASAKPTSSMLELGERKKGTSSGTGGATTSTVVDSVPSTVHSEQLARPDDIGEKKLAANAPAPSAMKDETAPAEFALGIESGLLAEKPESSSEENKNSALSSTMLASLDPQMTFEQKLVLGGGVDVLGNHAFPNEPLQLVVAVNNEAEQAIVEERLVRFFRDNSLLSANSVEFDSEWPDYGDLEANEVVLNEADSINLAEDELYYEGDATQNVFAPVGSRQYLVRLQTPKFNQVVNDLTTIGVAEVQLAVGNMRSERPEEVFKLANQATGVSVVEESQRARSQEQARTSRMDRRLPKASSNEQPQPVPPTAQWLQALHSYGLLGQGAARPQDRVAGRLGKQTKVHDADTNGLPDRVDDSSQSPGFVEIPSPMPQRQELLTLVIELTNKSVPRTPMKAKRDPPSKIEQPKIKQ